MPAHAIGRADFHAFRELIHREAGINLAEHKQALLLARLQPRLRGLGIATFADYYRLVVSDQAERVEMLDRISTNETHFFREPRQFDFLQKEVVPRWREEARRGVRSKSIRIWSAACSTGEEPYSIGMTLLHHFPPSDGWVIEIVATDLSTRVLKRATEGVWRIEKAADIPPAYLKAFMLRGTGPEEGRMKAGPQLRSIVRFFRLNLNDPPYPVPGPFDAIFCRNVLIYFDQAMKARVLTQLLRHLAKDGLLYLGHAESPYGLVPQMKLAGPTVYRAVPAR
jgi:chemotaxis protein methyltransferase CheR